MQNEQPIWTDEECFQLNAAQHNPEFHGYTCGNDSRHPPLIATRYGWRCCAKDCGYRQGWAHGVGERKLEAEKEVMPRELTPEECRDRFLQAIRDRVRYWHDESRAETTLEKLDGLAFSILSLMDGSSLATPVLRVVTSPHEGDKAYHESRGEDWWPEGADLGVLHEFWHKGK